METTIWGPAAWLFLHSVAFQYPDNPSDLIKQKYYTFFNSIKNVLPCPNCQKHYTENLVKTGLNHLILLQVLINYYLVQIFLSPAVYLVYV